MGRRLPVLLLLALFAVIALPCAAEAAITGTVYMDYNSSGSKDTGTYTPGSSSAGTGLVSATDIGVAGAVINAYDASGTRVSGPVTSAADGTYTICSTGCSGTVRVEFTTPAGYQPSFQGTNNGTSVRFVNATTSNVDYAVEQPSQYCQNSPRLVTCEYPWVTTAAATPRFGGVTLRSEFNGSLTMTDVGETTSFPGPSGGTKIANGTDLGAVFGIGVDRSSNGVAGSFNNVFFGTYVKRHVPYGLAGGVNAIYRVYGDPTVGAANTVSTFVTLGVHSLPAHNATVPSGTVPGSCGATPYRFPQPCSSYPPYSVDGIRADGIATDPFHMVGRAGLGDVDVTPDGTTLYAVEMYESAPVLWKVPINGTGNAVTAGTPVSIAIPTPSTFNSVTCPGTWHPMGIGLRGTRVLVGGVCGDETGALTAPTAFVLELNTSTNVFTTIAALSLDYPKAGSNASISTMQSLTSGSSGLWHPWDDSASSDTRGASPQPMLANVEIRDDGSLVLAFRDRYLDRATPKTVDYEAANLTNPPMTPVGNAGADTLLLCFNSGTSAYVKETSATCNGTVGANVSAILSSDPSNRPNSPLYYWNGYSSGFSSGANHPYTSLGGTAMIPGSPVLWSTTYDVSGIYQQGVHAMGPCASRSGSGSCGPAGAADGAVIGGNSLTENATDVTACGYGTGSSCWGKGNGLADLEILCNAAPVQIGNRIWVDANGNGIQDPGEAPLSGVTVRLYDATGSTLIGTAVTNVNGEYYFSSLNTEAAAGTGDNVGGGVVPGTAYVIRLDNPADYSNQGPLVPYALTSATQSSAGAGSQSTSVDSNAAITNGFPQLSVAAHAIGQNDHTFDVGFVVPQTPVAVGDYVWIDANANGIQDGGESPLAGVVVTLLNTDGTRATDINGTTVATATTDNAGHYLFDNLLPGNYKVQFTLPTGYTFTSTGAGTAATDSNPTPTGTPTVGVTATFSVSGIAAGQTVADTDPSTLATLVNPTIDAGVIAPVSPSPTLVGMGDKVWIDANQNGVQDGGELPLAGVVVNLLNADGTPATDAQGNPVAAATTDASGNYFIGNLLPGTYKAKFTLPSGYVFTTSGAGTSATGSDPTPGANPLIGTTGTFTISGSATGDTTSSSQPNASFANLTIDAGVVPLVGMGDKTWIDANANGVQDAGEAALPGVVVQLLNAAGSGPATDAQGNPVAPVTTDANGNYFVGNLLPGSYKAQFTLPAGYAFTSTSAGTSATDSNPTAGANPLIGTTAAFTIGGSATGDTTASSQATAKFANLTIDAGVVPLVGMGDYTWIDANQNGIQDAGEAPLAGVVVQLMNAAGTAVATDAQGNPVPAVTTDATGHYFIGGLLAGNYTAKFTLPSGYAFTTSGAGTAATDSNPSVAVNAQTKLTPSFAIAASASGNTTAVTQPNAQFANLTVDAGVVPLVGMGDKTWVDANANGIQDPGELPLAGVVVTLLNAAGTAPATDAQGNPVAPVTTDANGNYFIGGLLPGTYKAQFDLPTGYMFTSTGHGTSATDSNPTATAQPLVGVTPAFTIGGSATGDTTAVSQPNAQFANLTIDAGVITSGSSYTGGPVGMGNFTWIDTNGNGIQDVGEAPLPGVVVTLLTASGQPALDYQGNPVPSVTTDANGAYFIGNLAAGTYTAQFALPGGYKFTTPTAGAGTSANDSNPTPGANPLIGTTGTFTIGASAGGDTTAVSGNPTANFANLTIDAGVVPVVGMGDYTWIDTNGNGQQDVGEAPLAGVIVQLLDSAGSGPATDAQGVVVSPVTTDATGHYFVGNLLPGTYKAQFTLPNGYIFTTPTTGAGATDSNPTPVTGAPQIGVTPSFTIAASATGDTTVSTQPNASFANLTIDAGVVPVVGMGDYTWIDDNQNGIQDPGEAPLPGVVVELLKADGTAAVDAQGAPVASVVTDANGAYFIGNLLPGSYKARFTIPSGYTFTSALAGTSANDSNPSPGANPLIGTTPTFTIAGGTSGDTTPVTGKWRASFANLTIDAGVVPVPSQNGGGSGGGSGGSGSGGGGAAADGTTASTTPSTPTKAHGTSGPLTGPGRNGANSNGVNGGPGSTNPVPGANSGALVGVGDLVWFDTNSNGVQDSGELPMRGATVVILNANGTRARDANGKVIPAQTTDAQGHYFFANLQPGRYQMKFIYPQSYVATVPGKGAKAKGSNAKATAKRNVAITPTFVVAGTSYGETAKATGNRKAVYANPSIDAGVVPPWAQRVMGPESVTG